MNKMVCNYDNGLYIDLKRKAYFNFRLMETII